MGLLQVLLFGSCSKYYSHGDALDRSDVALYRNIDIQRHAKAMNIYYRAIVAASDNPNQILH